MSILFKQKLSIALDLFQRGEIGEADLIAKDLLMQSPKSAHALHLRGVIAGLQHRHRDAESFLLAAVSLDKKNHFIHFNLAKALSEQGKDNESLSWHRKALELDPRSDKAWLSYGLSLSRLGYLKEAVVAFDRALTINNGLAEGYASKGSCLRNMGALDEALALHNRAVELSPSMAEAWLNRGNTLRDLRRHEEAVASYERAIELKPDYARAWSGRGNSLRDLQRHEEALASYERSIELKPDCAEAWNDRGNALRDLRRYGESLASYERSIELKPDYAEAWSNRGNALCDLRRHDEALASYERCIELKSDYALAWSNRGIALRDLRRYEEASASYRRSIELKPEADYILGDLVNSQMQICNWTDLDGRCKTLESRLLGGDRASTPFPVLGLFDDPQLQRQCAELYSKDKLGHISLLGPIGRRATRPRIRVGYFSMDFQDHPVAHLMAELIETHDRNKFEIYGFSFGVNADDAMRKRLEMAFDKFLEVRHLSDLDIARLARDHEIDIAIDLGGYTHDSRPAIFAHRAALIQINYLGFPGTMGTEHLDYFIGDRVTVTEENIEHFSEKIIFLPNSFQANTSSRPIGSRKSSRASYGLPESGFVFCCFNNVWKITPDVFKVWASILKRVDDSVLWLSVDSDSARLRLRNALKNLDVDGHRLLFSPRVTREIYFDQYNFADLFLDTLPYNAGTTASDALWMGTPLVTLAGGSFAGRMATSLLHSAGLSELITHTRAEYESLAIELARNPEKYSSLKARLVENRATCPLFNTALFTQHIEQAYRTVYDRYHNGLSPDHIHVRS